MAELILTDDEKATDSYLDWSDESLGKAVRNFALALQDVYGKDSIWGAGAAHVLISMCRDTNAAELKIDVGGVTRAGRPCGDWNITVRKTK